MVTECVRVADVELPPFWTLVNAHGDELFAYARRLAGPAGEDVYQDALLKALRAYPGLQRNDHLRAWLYRVVTTTAFDHRARRARRREHPVAQIDDSPSQDGMPDGGFEALIADLPDGPRRALALRFVADLSYDAMAERLGCTPEAARQRVSSAVRTLRRRLT